MVHGGTWWSGSSMCTTSHRCFGERYANEQSLSRLIGNVGTHEVCTPGERDAHTGSLIPLKSAVRPSIQKRNAIWHGGAFSTSTGMKMSLPEDVVAERAMCVHCTVQLFLYRLTKYCAVHTIHTVYWQFIFSRFSHASCMPNLSYAQTTFSNFTLTF